MASSLRRGTSTHHSDDGREGDERHVAKVFWLWEKVCHQVGVVVHPRPNCPPLVLCSRWFPRPPAPHPHPAKHVRDPRASHQLDRSATLPHPKPNLNVLTTPTDGRCAWFQSVSGGETRHCTAIAAARGERIPAMTVTHAPVFHLLIKRPDLEKVVALYREEPASHGW
jgi:hypothetical protein